MSVFGSTPAYIDVTRLVRRSRAGRRPTGVDRVCLAYVHHFRFQCQALLVDRGTAMALSPTASMALFDWLLAWEAGRPHGSFWSTVGALLRMPLRAVPRGCWVLNMGHSGLDRPGYLAWLRRKQIRLLVMTHDLIPITHPHFCKDQSTAAHHRRLKLILECAVGIISNSTDTAQQLRQHAAAEEAPLPPLQVIPLGIHRHWRAEAPVPAERPAIPYFLLLGTLEPRKNHAFILYLWDRLRHEHPEKIPHLLIVGQVGWMCDALVQRLLQDTHIREWVTWLPQCSDNQLAYHLDHAQALLFPSAAEGYGLPLLEALDRGTPVLASPLPAFREVAGDIPEYLDLDDEEGWLGAIRAYSDPLDPRRQAQLARLGQFRSPSWAAHFQAFEHFVTEL